MSIVIVTGGSGYIGTAVTERLLDLGYMVINFDRAEPKYKGTNPNYYFIRWDLLDKIDGPEFRRVLKGIKVDGFIHFAAWKDLPGSFDTPFDYYENNIVSLLNSLELANEVRTKSFIFSSSAGLYSDELEGAVKESDKIVPSSPYGYTKMVGERIVHDCCQQFGIKSVALRYFNPIGATEWTYDDSDSLFGAIFNCVKNNKELTIFGGDWNTKDGTCIRDFIDIRDLANAHVHFINHEHELPITVNVGTGVETTILDVAKAAKAIMPGLSYKIGPRRQGDAVGGYADTHQLNEYGFKTQYTVKDSLREIYKATQERPKYVAD